METRDFSFVPYAKMSDSVSRWEMDPSTEQKFKQVRWCVTEKIHGANCCFFSDGKEVWSAKRKGILKPGEMFFPGHREVFYALSPKVLQLFQILTSEVDLESYRRNEKINFVYLYGELFGGSYPHQQVSQASEIEAIQTGNRLSEHFTSNLGPPLSSSFSYEINLFWEIPNSCPSSTSGVFYSPDVRFCAFDIFARTETSSFYVDYQLAITFFQVRLSRFSPLKRWR
eukprot:TRINITY_DN6941_c0_g1_i1.p1 TRINITY_DN6941_c0_g1~~TRINITY_DN6941_c0_g1_i1.p1  ORF type:complete len:227 (-),score=35.13 TRINITY_DN6941_c0_g1_i1:744-1424(-)